MPRITLIEGPVGAGKSTYAAKLALDQTAVHLDLDVIVLEVPEAEEITARGIRLLPN